MKRLLQFCIALVFAVCLPWQTIVAKEPNYPGKELNGVWQVVKWDFRGIKDMNSPAAKDFMSPISSSINVIVLPIGQKIEFWLTGDSHFYGDEAHHRSGMDIGMKLVFPIDKDICKLEAWDYICDENGHLDLNNKERQKDIKDNTLLVTDADDGMLNKARMESSELSLTRSFWPNVKNYYYDLDMNAGSRSLSVYPMKDGNHILFYAALNGARFGVILKRSKK